MAETYIGAALAALGGAIIGVVSWAWQLSQRVAVLEANATTAAMAADRLEQAILRMDAKIDTVISHMIERKP